MYKQCVSNVLLLFLMGCGCGDNPNATTEIAVEPVKKNIISVANEYPEGSWVQWQIVEVIYSGKKHVFVLVKTDPPLLKKIDVISISAEDADYHRKQAD